MEPTMFMDKLRDGMYLHVLPTKKFKTALIRVIFRTPLLEVTAAGNALIAQITGQSSKEYPNVQSLNRRLDELYGAFFSGNVNKIGEIQTLEWTLACPVPERVGAPELLDDAVRFLCGMICNPLVNDGGFDIATFEREKMTLAQEIEARINDKMSYAYERCIEETCKDEPFGVHRLGSLDTLQPWTPESLWAHHKDLLDTAPIDIVVVGDIAPDVLKELFNKYMKLPARSDAQFKRETIRKIGRNVRVEDPMDVRQGKLNIGFVTGIPYENSDYDALLLFSILLGGGASSRLFQTVREEQSLCYSIYARMEKYKSLLVVGAGIDIDKEPEVLQRVTEELTKLRNGEFTDKELELARMTLMRSLNGIQDSQSSQADYYFNQHLSTKRYRVEDTLEAIARVDRDAVIRSAIGIGTDVVYFLTGHEEAAE